MNIVGFFIIVMSVVTVSPLQADSLDISEHEDAQESVKLKRDENHLERMQADRSLDNERARQAQQEFRKGTVEMYGHNEQQMHDVETLKSVENQVTAGQKQKSLTHQSYKEAMRQYGSEDPRSMAAKKSWKQSQQAMGPLLQSRQTLKGDIQQGGRLVHNEKTVLGIQKRTMDSDARYRANDDRQIKKEEKNVSEDRKAMTQNIARSEPPHAP